MGFFGKDKTDAEEHYKVLQKNVKEINEVIEKEAAELRQQRPRLFHAIHRAGNRNSLARVNALVTDHHDLAEDLTSFQAQNIQLQQDLHQERDDKEKAFRQIAQLQTELHTHEQVHREQLNDVQNAHQREKEKMLKDIDGYGTALLARDDFRPTSDAELKARFLDLAQDVEDLARLQWKDSYPETQRLRRYFLQDSIWTYLYEHIFCSPFRVFGPEGQSLEQQWNQECGADPQRHNGYYTWPPSQVETERWRYASIKECHASLQRPVPSEFDPRARLKKGFKESTDRLKTTLMVTLDEVAILDEYNVQAIGTMTIKAASLWLECAMQRCRILVVMQRPDTSSITQRMYHARQASLALVVVPTLQRQGNNKGQDMHISSTIAEGVMAHVHQGVLSTA